MAIITAKSPSITNWDALPIIIPTTGEGADGPRRVINDSVGVATTDSIGSIYRLVRVPTNAKIKQVLLDTLGDTTMTADIDVAFSDSTTDGTQAALQGGIVQITGPVDNKLFGAARPMNAQSRIDITFLGTFLYAHQNLPLWQVLVALGATQFVADPGGSFDIVAKSVVTDTVAGTINLEVDFVE
jgi:hypothetical protein